MTTGAIEVARQGAVQVLRMVRAAKRNALDRAMYAALSNALEAGEADPEIAVHVMLGSDGFFTAGNDLADFLGAAEPGGSPAMDEVMRFVRLLPHLGKPLVAGVDGPAIGIGTTLLFHCDLVFASDRAQFATPFTDLGLVPEAASSLLAPRLMGHPLAFELLVLGATFSAERMLRAGLVNAVVPAAELEATTLEAARALAAKPAEAVALARRLLKGDVTEISARTEAEARLFAERLTSPEARAAFARFFARRGPA